MCNAPLVTPRSGRDKPLGPAGPAAGANVWAGALAGAMASLPGKVRRRLAGHLGEVSMTISRIISGRSGTLVSATPDMSVRAVVALLAERRIGALPIMTGDAVVGIFSERDVLYCLARDGAGVLDQPVSAVMTSPPITVTPDTAILGALSLMSRRRIRHLPVVEGDKVVGFVSIGDLVKHRIDAIQQEAEAMRSYIQMA